jgi:hypothetical protein
MCSIIPFASLVRLEIFDVRDMCLWLDGSARVMSNFVRFFRFVSSRRRDRWGSFQYRHVAQSRVVDVLDVKDPELMSHHFLNCFHDFNDQIQPGSISQDPFCHDLFRLSTAEQRRATDSLMIS